LSELAGEEISKKKNVDSCHWIKDVEFSRGNFSGLN